MSAELAQVKIALTTSQQREKQSGSLVQELTAMVKEQKSRIADLIKSKRDAVTDLKVRVYVLYFSFLFCHHDNPNYFSNICLQRNFFFCLKKEKEIDNTALETIPKLSLVAL